MTSTPPASADTADTTVLSAGSSGAFEPEGHSVYLTEEDCLDRTELVGKKLGRDYIIVRHWSSEKQSMFNAEGLKSHSLLKREGKIKSDDPQDLQYGDETMCRLIHTKPLIHGSFKAKEGSINLAVPVGKVWVHNQAAYSSAKTVKKGRKSWHESAMSWTEYMNRQGKLEPGEYLDSRGSTRRYPLTSTDRAIPRPLQNSLSFAIRNQSGTSLEGNESAFSHLWAPEGERPFEMRRTFGVGRIFEVGQTFEVGRTFEVGGTFEVGPFGRKSFTDQYVPEVVFDSELIGVEKHLKPEDIPDELWEGPRTVPSNDDVKRTG